MRLQSVDEGHRLLAKIKLAFIGLSAGDRAPDILRLLLYRPELFGKSFMQYVNRALRGESEWSVGERELFAAYISKLNRCEFCLGSHYAVAAKVMGAEVVEQALDDWRKAELRDEVQGALGLLETLTPNPSSIGMASIEAAEAKGLSRGAIEEVIHICAMFCTINALADSLGFRVPAASTFARMAGPLLKHGYAM